MPTEERLARRMADLADAQLHATLALAAATALSAVTEEAPMAEFEAWRRVAGVPADTKAEGGTA